MHVVKTGFFGGGWVGRLGIGGLQTFLKKILQLCVIFDLQEVCVHIRKRLKCITSVSVST